MWSGSSGIRLKGTCKGFAEVRSSAPSSVTSNHSCHTSSSCTLTSRSASKVGRRRAATPIRHMSLHCPATSHTRENKHAQENQGRFANTDPRQRLEAVPDNCHGQV